MSAAKPSSIPNASTSFCSRYPSVSLTRQGVMYVVVTVILLLTAINYSNHNILIVALFIMSLFAVSLLMAVIRFQGMAINLGEVQPVFAGQEAQLLLDVSLKHSGETFPVEIQVGLDSGEVIVQEALLAEDELNKPQIRLTPEKRGRYTINNVLICTSFPFGLFRLQQSQATQQLFWVYPKPLEEALGREGGGNLDSKHGNDSHDSIILRQYRLGDPVRRIHKKSLAMGQTILVKDVEPHTPDSQWLLWDQRQNLTVEKRLQLLTQQVLEADHQGRSFGLSMPKGKINPSTGETHKHQCLRMLAEY